jgi:hypothetical protein
MKRRISGKRATTGLITILIISPIRRLSAGSGVPADMAGRSSGNADKKQRVF